VCKYTHTYLIAPQAVNNRVCSSSGVFMMDTPSYVKMHCEITEPESCQNIFLSFFFFFFRRASSKLHDAFMTVLTQNSSIEQCASPSLLHNFEASRGGSKQSLLNCGFICATISFIIVCMRTNHLAMKRNHYSSSLN